LYLKIINIFIDLENNNKADKAIKTEYGIREILTDINKQLNINSSGNTDILPIIKGMKAKLEISRKYICNNKNTIIEYCKKYIDDNTNGSQQHRWI
jgi:hypothetical protein